MINTLTTCPNSQFHWHQLDGFCASCVQTGARIRVKDVLPMPNDSAFKGMAGRFVRYGRTGYAIVALDIHKGQSTVMLHPENIDFEGGVK